MALSFMLAWLTYRLVERPIRFGPKARVKTAALAALMLIVGYAGYETYSRDGLPLRKGMIVVTNEGDIGHTAFHRYVDRNFYLCTPKHIADAALRWEGFVRCMQSQKSANVEIALLGDSHAEHLFLGIAEALPNRNVVFYIKGDPPFLDHPEFSAIYQHVIDSRTIKKVVLTMNWVGRIREVPRGSTMQDELLRIAESLLNSGKEVWVAEGVPLFPFLPEKCQGVRRFSSKKTNCEVERGFVIQLSASYMSALTQVMSREPRIKLLRLQHYLCNEDRCSQAANGKLLFRDNMHLNINGSRYIGEMIARDNPDLQQ